jgi:hypothetical protein
MDPDSRATVQVADTAVSSYSSSNATFDPIGKRYFIGGSANLLAINLATRVTTTLYADGLELFEFDPSTGLLCGMKAVFPSGPLFVFSLNPNTGAIARIADTGVTSRSTGPVFDTIARRYIFGVAGDKLLVVDLATGTTTQGPSGLGGLVFDPVTRLFYGIQLMPASGTVGVFSLNLTTGARTFIADIGLTATSGVMGDPTWDPIGKRYFLTVSSTTNQVVVVNLVTGVVKQLNNALYYNKFDSGQSVSSIPTLNLAFLSAAAILLAFAGLWRTARLL